VVILLSNMLIAIVTDFNEDQHDRAAIVFGQIDWIS
jgi:hypothetical protein